MNNEEIRNLYWYSEFSFDYIKKQTGLKDRDIRTIAGNYKANCPFCEKEQIYKNRSELFGVWKDKKNHKVICDLCRNLALSISTFYSQFNKIKFGGVNENFYDFGYIEQIKKIYEIFEIKGIEYSKIFLNNILDNIEFEYKEYFKNEK